MRSNTDKYLSLNESINEVQNPHVALNEAQEYASVLESAVLALCEEFGLDPDAVLEMAITVGRAKEFDKKFEGMRRRGTLNKAGDPTSKRGKAIQQQAWREAESAKIYGKGGKVVKGVKLATTHANPYYK